MIGFFLTITFTLFVLYLILRDHKIRNTLYIDKKGYYRDGYNQLVHRRIAYRHIYEWGEKYPLRFGEYEVHHKDRNKLNNAISNLQILTSDEHKKIHGIY